MESLYPNLIPMNKDDFILSIEKVGPKIGAELRGDAVMAILSALFLILSLYYYKIPIKICYRSHSSIST